MKARLARLRPWWPWLGGGLALGLLLLPTLAEARPGGGQSFGGGSSFGGGGGGGGGGDGGGLAHLLIWLVIRHPKIGVPVLIVVGIWWVIKEHHKGKRQDWSTTAKQEARSRQTVTRPSPRRLLTRLRERDPDFSVLVFEDFLYALYAKAHTARGDGKLGELSAWLSADARATLAALDPEATAVTGVVIGAMRIVGVSGIVPESDRIGLTVAFETNLTVHRGGRQQAVYLEEVWRLSRAAGAISKAPDQARVFNCPACHAAVTELDEGTCGYCGTKVDSGDFDWVVGRIELVHRQNRKPQLTGTTQEQGTGAATRQAPGADARLAALFTRDAALDLPGLEARVRLIHRELNDAWTEQNWSKARPFVTDALYESWTGWMNLYADQGLKNVLKETEVTRIALAECTMDRWYDGVTLRVFATGYDYTEDQDGRVVGGDPNRKRPYSEYWTLVRSHEASGKPKSEPICPNCGAPLDKVNQTGTCEYCQAKVTSGKFDWVLSRVEQDDGYTG